MKNRKLLVLGLILSFLIFLSCIILAVFVSNAQEFSEKNTTELSATLLRIDVLGAKNEQYVTVYTREYNDRLAIISPQVILELEDLASMQQGEIISFRVENTWAERLMEVPFVYIVSLSTAEKEYVSLDSINEFNAERQGRIRTTVIAVGLLFLCLLLFFLVKLVRSPSKWRRE